MWPGVRRPIVYHNPLRITYWYKLCVYRINGELYDVVICGQTSHWWGQGGCGGWVISSYGD